MTRFSVVYIGKLNVQPEYEGEVFDFEEEISRIFDETMEELLALDIIDPVVAGSMASGDIEVSMETDASTPEQAIQTAGSALRSAFHAAKVFTPGWPEFSGQSKMQVLWHRAAADDAILCL